MEISRHSEQAIRDQQWVKAAIKGEKKAFSNLMDAYFDAIFFTLLKMVNDRRDTEDLTAEVFGKAYKSLKNYSTEFAFSTWLFRIAANHGIDFLRKKKGLTISLDEEMNNFEFSVTLQDNKLSPEELIIQKQEHTKLFRNIEQLKPFWQKLIDLRYFQELSYEEIAEELDIPMGTVKNQLHRAKESLSKNYGLK